MKYTNLCFILTVVLLVAIIALSFPKHAQEATFDTLGVPPLSLNGENDLSIENAIIAEFGAGSVMVDVARCESNFTQFNPDGSVLHGVVNPSDTGIFEINQKYHLNDSIKMGLDINTIDGNIKYARYLYDTQGTAPWKASSKCWDK